ncbi:MAG: CDP-alcohol phosphatidyltransferase family protein [Myxococcota bacterium]|nr:CDP-alcohol phosphatidyltransferase family protein [Myxococcota bacterium]
MERGRESCILFAPPGSSPAGSPLFGLHLAERTVLAFLRAGVRRFFLTGDADAVKGLAALLATGRCREARVQVLAPHHSLVPILEREEACFVARTDYLYDRRLVARFVEGTRSASSNVAAVDYRAEALAAQDGASRTAGFGDESGPGGSLRAAGRGLMAPVGVLTGLARATTSFARAFEDAPTRYRSIENALTLLARREPVQTWAVTGLWQSVRPEAGARQDDLVIARRKALGGAVGVSDGVVARHLNRPLSRRITERLLSRDVKPWQISLASFAATIGAGLSFAVGHATTGGLVAQFASVLDGVDGELAAIRYQDSPFGGVYDALLDRIGDAALIGGMTLYAWLAGGGNSVVALGFAAVAGSSLSMLVKEKYAAQFHRPYSMEREGRWRWLLLGRDGRLFLTLVAGLTGQIEAVLAYLAVGTHVHAGVRIYRIRAEVVRAAA